jgi:hypothetical protein
MSADAELILPRKGAAAGSEALKGWHLEEASKHVQAD